MLDTEMHTIGTKGSEEKSNTKEFKSDCGDTHIARKGFHNCSRMGHAEALKSDIKSSAHLSIRISTAAFSSARIHGGVCSCESKVSALQSLLPTFVSRTLARFKTQHHIGTVIENESGNALPRLVLSTKTMPWCLIAAFATFRFKRL